MSWESLDQILTLRKLEIMTLKRNIEASRVFEESLTRLSEKQFAHSRYLHFKFFFQPPRQNSLMFASQVFDLRSLIHHGEIFSPSSSNFLNISFARLLVDFCLRTILRFSLSPFIVKCYTQTDSKDHHVQLKSGDIYATEFQGPGCFAAKDT